MGRRVRTLKVISSCSIIVIELLNLKVQLNSVDLTKVLNSVDSTRLNSVYKSMHRLKTHTIFLFTAHFSSHKRQVKK